MTLLYDEALRAYKNGDLDFAAEKLRTLIVQSPDLQDAYEALSVILYNQKKYDEAIETLKKWLALNPDAVMAHTNLSRCYMSKGMILEAEQAQAESRRLSWKSELLAKKQDIPKINFDEQIEKFKKVIAYDPLDVLGYFSLGSVYLESGQKREALETFEKAVEVDPQHSSSYLGLGMTLEGLGDLKKAAEVYRKGIAAADQKGDMMTQRKMEARLKALQI